ncbi:MAG: type II and III secretion system protein [Thermodesulfobacteriota bacterium]
MKRRNPSLLLLIPLVALLAGCAAQPAIPPDHPLNSPRERAADLIRQEQAASGARISEPVTQLPVRFQQPSYVLSGGREGIAAAGAVPVGADISTKTGPVPLRDIIKKLAALKNMNISWASDVDQGALVDVDIRAEDDFFGALDHLLRQLDYFHQVDGNTIVVKYKEVRKFHVAMPFVASTYSHGIGGDVLGSGSDAGNMKGKLELTSDSNSFDIWKNIQENLDKVLEIWTAPTPQTVAAPAPAPGAEGAPAQAAAPAPAPSRPPVGKGYYTIDRPIGLITVTAPRSLLEKISSYIENLKGELYRQVSIEAKIVEVSLNDDNTSGINWEGLLQDMATGFDFNMDFQKLNPTYPGYGRFLTLGDKSFTLFLDAIQEQGTTDVIANPRLSVMNGQPAMINIGANVTYIDSVTSSANDNVITYTVSTSSVMSGLGMSVVATIMDNNEIILTLTPVTSKLEEPIEYRNFGTGNTVGLPKVNIREMSTMVRVKSDEMLVIGGLIDNTEATSDSKVRGLGDLPGIKKLFSNGGTNVQRKELIIFLKPKIIS